MAQVRLYDKRRDITYVYDSVYVFDEALGRKKNVRHLIGKIDKNTGELIKTGSRGRPKKDPATRGKDDHDSRDYRTLYQRSQNEIAFMKREIDGLKRENAGLKDQVKTLSSELRGSNAALHAVRSALEAVDHAANK